MNSHRARTIALAALGCVALSGCLEVTDRIEANGAGQVRFTTLVQMDPVVLDALAVTGIEGPADEHAWCAAIYANVLEDETPQDTTQLAVEKDLRHAFRAIDIHLGDARTTDDSQVQCTWSSRWFAPLDVDARTRAALWTDPQVHATELVVSPRRPGNFDELRESIKTEAGQGFDPRECVEPQVDPTCDAELVRLVQAADAGDEEARERLEAMERIATYAVQASIDFVMDAVRDIDYRIELDGVRPLAGFTDEDGIAVWEGTVGDLLESEQRYAIELH